MSLPLKYSTASQTVILGPFLDDSDGKTAETGLTIANTAIKLKKHNGTSDTNKNSGGATHIANGYYYTTLDATDTNTIGRLVISVNASGALPVWHEFVVYPAEAYDYLFAAAGTDYMKVDIAQINGSDVSTSSAQLGVNLVNIAGSAVSTSTAQLGVNAVQAGGTAWGSGAITAASIASNAITDTKIATGAITSTKFASGAITADAIAADAIGASELAADAASEIGTAVWATATRTLSAATNITSTGGTITLDASGYVTYANTAPPTAAAIADAVWDETSTGHTDTGKAGAKIWTDIPAILDDTGTSGVVVASISSGAITAGSIAADAIGASELAADAVTEIASGVWASATRTLSAATNVTSTGGTITLDGSGYVTYANAAPPTASAIADAVWDETSTGHTTAGTAGAQLWTNIDAILTDTAEIGTAGAGLTAIPWNSSWDAEVQSEVFDALDAAYTDATSLTSNGLLDRIRILCWILRNKIEVTDANGNTVIYKDDSTTTAFSVNSMLTDNSTTTTRLRAA